MQTKDKEMQEIIEAILGEQFMHIVVAGGCKTNKTHNANTGCNKFDESNLED
jgi:hypothetical protein